MSDFSKFNRFLNDAELAEPLESTHAKLKMMSSHLAKLPRITREFLTVMFERREMDRRGGIGASDRIEINADKLDRISRYPDHEGELRILSGYKLAYLDEPSDHGESYHWRISFPGISTNFVLAFLDYVESNGIPLHRPLVSLDFSAF